MGRRPAIETPVYAPGKTVEDALEAVAAALRAHRARQHCETTARLDQALATLQRAKGEADRRTIEEAKGAQTDAREFVKARKAQAAGAVREQLAEERRAVYAIVQGLHRGQHLPTIAEVRREATRKGIGRAQLDAHLLELDRQFRIDLKTPNDWRGLSLADTLNVPGRGNTWFVTDRREGDAS